jgi:hypothetical protein
MRKSIIAALAASVIAVPAYAADVMVPPPPPVAGIPAPAPAAAPTVAGYVGLYGGVVTDFTNVVAAVAADAAIAISRDRMDIQLELRDQTFFSGGTTTSIAAAMIHAYRRNASTAFGLFGGYEALISGGAASILHLGAEAVMFRSRTTFYAQAAAIYVPSGPAWAGYARGVVRFFPRDNVRLEGGVRYLFVPGGGGSLITPEIEGEFQLPGRPLSFVSTVRAVIPVGGGGVALLTGLAGLRFNFGGGDLIDQVAPMDTVPFIY